MSIGLERIDSNSDVFSIVLSGAYRRIIPGRGMTPVHATGH